MSKNKNLTSSEVGKVIDNAQQNSKGKAAERIENFCKSSYTSQTLSGQVQIRDEMDDNDEQMIMESDSDGGQQDDEMSGPLELEAISEKQQQLESTIKKKTNIIQSAPSKKEEKDDAIEEAMQDVPRVELGGEVCYDSQAQITGCTKIVKYFEDSKDLPERRIDPYILFGQDEVKEAVRETGVGEKAKDRDFNSEQERTIFRNLPRFQTQRNYKHFKYQQFVQEQKNVLIFDSRFENGNLRKACKVSNIEYNLWLENDSNTKGHTQWYYFKVTYKDIASRAEKKTHKIKLNIMNLAKTTSLYQIGMKPVIYSQNRKNEEGVGWFRGGDDISYKQNSLPRSYQLYNGESKEGGQTQRRQDSQFFSANSFLQTKNGAGEGNDHYYTLSFTYEFEANKDDSVWFSHAIPATFTSISQQLKEYRDNEKYDSIFRAELMCLSLGRLPVPLLTITDNIKSYMSYADEQRVQQQMPGIVKRSLRQKYRGVVKLLKQAQQMRGKSTDLLRSAVEEEITQFYQYNEDQLLNANLSFAGFGQRLLSYVRDHSLKKAIVITSRVHPGEPQASHMLTGLIRYLMSPEAAVLRQHFVFRIVPMLNPDGVVYGNYRCSLLGCDLNRKWDRANRLLHPTIFYSKSILRNLCSERKILMFTDLHGHSRKQNAFFYGCMFRNYEHDGRVKNAQLRIVPLMCCQKNELFQLKGCNFNMTKSKEATARMTVFREFSVMLSYTVECSFFGKITRDGKLLHMQLEDYESLGETVPKAMHHYLPSQMPKLQFFTGKVLKVFHDQFIKLVPEHIIRREMDRMKQLEEQKALKDKQKRDAMKKKQKSFVQQSLQKKHTKNDLMNDDQDPEVANKKLIDEFMHNKNMNNSLMNTELERAGENGESPIMIDDDEDNENLNAILQQYQLNLNSVISIADSDVSPKYNQNDFNSVRPSGGSTSEDKVDMSSVQGAFSNQKEDWNDFEAFIQKIQDKKDKIEGESGDDSSSSANEPAIETKKKVKKKKTKFILPSKKQSESSILASVLIGKSIKQQDTNSKTKGTHLRSKTLALQQKNPSFSRKQNNSNFQGAMTSQNFMNADKPQLPTGAQGASGNLALMNQTNSNQQPITTHLSSNGNPPPSPSVLSSIISPRRATGLADGALAMPILRKKRMRQGTMGQLTSHAQPTMAGQNSAEVTPTDSFSQGPSNNDLTQMSHIVSDDRSNDQIGRKLDQVQQSLINGQSRVQHHTPPLPKKHSRTQSTRITSSLVDPQVALQFNIQSNMIPVIDKSNKEESTPNFNCQNSSPDKKLNYAAALLQSQHLNKQTLNLIQNLSNLQKQKLNSIMQQKKQKPTSDVDQEALTNLKIIQEQQMLKQQEKQNYHNQSQVMTKSTREAREKGRSPMQTPDETLNQKVTLTESRKTEPMKSGQVSLKGSIKELVVSPSFALPEISSNSKNSKGKVKETDSSGQIGSSFEKSKQLSLPGSRLRRDQINEPNTDYKQHQSQARQRLNINNVGKSLDLSSSDSNVELNKLQRDVSFQTEKKQRVRNHHGLLSQQPTPLEHFEKKNDQLNIPKANAFNIKLSTNEKTVLKVDQVNFNDQGSLSVGKKMQRAAPSNRLEGAFATRNIVFTSPSIENKLRIDESTDMIQKHRDFSAQMIQMNNSQVEQSDIHDALALGNVTDYLNTQLNFKNQHHEYPRDKSQDEVQLLSPAMLIPLNKKKMIKSDYDKPSSSNQKSRHFLSNARRNMFLTEQTEEYDNSQPTSENITIQKANNMSKKRQFYQPDEVSDRAVISGPVSRLNQNHQQQEFSNNRHQRHMSISNMAEMEQQDGQKLQAMLAPKKKESQDAILTRMGQKQFHNSVIMQLMQDGQFQMVNKGNFMIRSPDMSNSAKKKMMKQKRDQIGISYGSQEIDNIKAMSEFPDLNSSNQQQDGAKPKHLRINSMQNPNQLGLQNFRQQLRLDSNQMQMQAEQNEQVANYASYMLQDKLNQKRLNDSGMMNASPAQQSVHLFQNTAIHQAKNRNDEQLPQMPQTGTSKLSSKQWRHSHPSVPDSQTIQAMQQSQIYASSQNNNNQRKLFDGSDNQQRSENNTIYAHVQMNQNMPQNRAQAGFFGQDHQPNLIRPQNYDMLQKASKGLRTHEMKRGMKVQELQNEILHGQTLSGRRSPDLLQANQFGNQMINNAEKTVARQVLQDFGVQPDYQTSVGHTQLNLAQQHQNENIEGVQMVQKRVAKKNIGQSKRRQILQDQMATEMLQRQKDLQIQLHEHTALLKSLHQQLSASKRQGYDAM